MLAATRAARAAAGAACRVRPCLASRQALCRPPPRSPAFSRAAARLPGLTAEPRRPCASQASRLAAEATQRRTLRELWDLGRGFGAPPVATAQAVPATLFRQHLESAHHWRMQQIFGDPMSSTPPSAKHLFISCGVIEGIFLCVNIGTMSPLVFEMLMPYHLKYTGLILGWWGGTYVGLEVARYGPLANRFWSAARLAAGPLLVTLGVTGLVLADGVPGFPRLGPWPSYWLMISSFGGMALFDSALHRRQMLPPWLLKWKLGISGLIVASLLLGVLKGQWLERNAQQLIMAQAELDD